MVRFLTLGVKQIMNENKIYYKAKNIIIYNDDFLTTQCVEENSVDLIVTSPPYNVDIHYNSFDDKIPYKKYLEFTELWLEKAYKPFKGRWTVMFKYSFR